MDDKLARFNDYFQINEAIEVALEQVDASALPQDEQDLLNGIPPLFKLANEVSVLEQTALRPLRQLGDVANDLAEYLRLQSRKIDLLLSHILASEQQQDCRFKTRSFGGGGFIVAQPTEHQIGDYVRCKLFLQAEAAAVYCYAEVINIEMVNDQPYTTYFFSHITEQDQELIVRASLHAQSRMLKKKKTDKNFQQ